MPGGLRSQQRTHAECGLAGIVHGLHVAKSPSGPQIGLPVVPGNAGIIDRMSRSEKRAPSEMAGSLWLHEEAHERSGLG